VYCIFVQEIHFLKSDAFWITNRIAVSFLELWRHTPSCLLTPIRWIACKNVCTLPLLISEGEFFHSNLILKFGLHSKSILTQKLFLPRFSVLQILALITN
jgi:hypothetical protein